jgi:hypothetical protein
MRRLLVVLAVVGCEPRTRTGPPVEDNEVERDGRPAARAVRDAGADGSAAVIPIAPALLAAPAWIGRELRTGLIAPQSTLATWTLQRDGNQAVLTVDRQTASGMDSTIGPWSAKQTRRYVGTFETSRQRLRFTLADGAERLELVCSRSVAIAAGAAAVRKPGRHRAGTEECGDRGGWSPARTRQVHVLRCRQPDDEPEDRDTDRVDLRLAAAPGIEYLYVNDDCIMQGGGWRVLAVDGAVAPVR